MGSAKSAVSEYVYLAVGGSSDKSKGEHFKSEDIDPCFNPIKLHKLLRRLLHQRGSAIPDLVCLWIGERMTSDSNKAALLNEHFIAQCAPVYHCVKLAEHTTYQRAPFDQTSLKPDGH